MYACILRHCVHKLLVVIPCGSVKIRTRLGTRWQGCACFLRQCVHILLVVIPCGSVNKTHTCGCTLAKVCVHSQTVCTRFVSGHSLWIRKKNAHVWVHVGKGKRAFSDSVYAFCLWSYLQDPLKGAYLLSVLHLSSLYALCKCIKLLTLGGSVHGA